MYDKDGQLHVFIKRMLKKNKWRGEMIMKWISVNEKLPPEPVRQVSTLDKIMEAIEAEELVEYLVIIDGAKKATTLYYTGDGEFFDAITQDLYPVIAWEELPGVPDSYVEKSLVNQETEIIENKSDETGKEEYFSDKEYEKKQLFDVSVMIGCLIIRWITKYYSVSLICDCFMVIVLIDFLTNKNIYQQRKKRK